MDIVLIPGDGIGPEIAAAAVVVMEATGLPLAWEKRAAGDDGLARHGELVPAATLEAIRRVGAALKGPFTVPSGGTRRSPNQIIRRHLDLFACVRPLRDAAQEVDILLVRENTEDHYAAIEWMATPDVALALKLATRRGCERIVRFAYALASRGGRRRVTLVHKANNLKLTEGLLLDIARSVAPEYPALVLDDLLVDAAATRLVQTPQAFDVVLTSNTFGDILSGVGAGVVGGPGVVPSANLGDDIVVAEAAHGSAPGLAGTQRANPLAMIAAGALLLAARDHVQEARDIEEAIATARARGAVTPDLGGTASTDEVAQEVAREVHRLARSRRAPEPRPVHP
jgi:isocitrate dehydrogenase (NAD+)